MSDKKPNQKHRKVKQPVVVLTPEEQAKLKAALEAAEAERKAEVERIRLYGEAVPKMSHRQLVGEFKRLIKREYAGRPPEPQAGLNLALGSVFLTVLENTKTTVEKHTRRDQINPFGVLHAYPR